MRSRISKFFPDKRQFAIFSLLMFLLALPVIGYVSYRILRAGFLVRNEYVNADFALLLFGYCSVYFTPKIDSYIESHHGVRHTFLHLSKKLRSKKS